MEVNCGRGGETGRGLVGTSKTGACMYLKLILKNLGCNEGGAGLGCNKGGRACTMDCRAACENWVSATCLESLLIRGLYLMDDKGMAWHVLTMSRG